MNNALDFHIKLNSIDSEMWTKHNTFRSALFEWNCLSALYFSERKIAEWIKEKLLTHHNHSNRLHAIDLQLNGMFDCDSNHFHTLIHLFRPHSYHWSKSYNSIIMHSNQAIWLIFIFKSLCVGVKCVLFPISSVKATHIFLFCFCHFKCWVPHFEL